MVALAVSPRAYSETIENTSADYRLSVQVEQVDSIHWEALVALDNSGPVAALTLPLQWGHGRAPFRIDSADYAGLRTEYFSLKTFRVDSIKQTVLIGMISDLGGNHPPLEPGEGAIARLHFTTRRGDGSPLSLDTTFVPPHNTLQLVTPDVRAIRPRFDKVPAASGPK